MSEEKLKSGRTPEQQAARDARKAAKKAAAAAAEVIDSTSTADAVGSAPESSRKRRAAGDAEAEDADLLEIDLGAEAPKSKAEARAARKRAKRGEPEPAKRTSAAGADENATIDDKEKAAQDKARAKLASSKGQHSIWIGNLSFRTTPESLQEFLERGVVELGGEEDCVTRVNLPKKTGKGGFAENKGFAYCDFKSEALQRLAIALSERPFEGRRLLIKAGNDHAPTANARTPKPAAQASILAKQQHPESSTLFIGNLPFDVTEEELRDLVEKNAAASAPKEDEDGEDHEDDEEEKEDEDEEEEEDEDADETEAKPKAPVATSSRSGAKSGLIKTRVAQFEDTGRCKGFAFWDFKSSAHARAALLNRKNGFLRGNRLVLQFASESAAKRSGGRRGASGGAGAGGERRAYAPRPQRSWGTGNNDDGEGGESREFRKERGAGPGSGAPVNLRSEAETQARIASALMGGVDGGPAGVAHSETTAEGKRGGDKRGKKWEATGRPRPGAALAMAKREKVGIVESAGQKIVFD